MKLIDYEGLRAKGFDYSRPHIWRLVANGVLPKPVRIGQGQCARNLWIEEEIDAFIAQRIAERDGSAS